MTPRDEVGRRIRGLYGIAADERVAVAMLEGGCRLVQLRCKGAPKDDVVRLARALLPRFRAVGATLIVNDDPEVAAAAEADGVHVGQLDGDAATVRRIVGEGRIVGRSTNDLDQLRLATTAADYVAFGPVYETTNLSRPKTVRGVELLRRAREVAAGLPLVGIGGITPERLPEVRAAGVDAWAVIGAIAGAADPVLATRTLLS